MKVGVQKFEDWLKLIVVRLCHAYFGGFSTGFKLYIKEPEDVGNDLGRFYSKGEYSDEPFIEISSNLLIEVWRSEAVRRRDAADYYLVVLKSAHTLAICGCENKTVCDAWRLLIDTLVHELTHLYCDRKYKNCDEHKAWCEKYHGHSPHFLYHAMLKGIDLAGVFERWPDLKDVRDKIRMGWKPGTISFADFCQRIEVEGRIKPLLPQPNSETVEPESVKKIVEEAEEEQADEDYVEEEEDFPLGIGA